MPPFNTIAENLPSEQGLKQKALVRGLFFRLAPLRILSVQSPGLLRRSFVRSDEAIVRMKSSLYASGWLLQ